jgi:hypothetical protein
VIRDILKFYYKKIRMVIRRLRFLLLRYFPRAVDPVYGLDPTGGLARGRNLGLVISLCAAVEHLRLS